MNTKNIYEKRSICTIVLVLVNVAVFFFLTSKGMTEDAEFMLEHGAMYVPYVLQGEYQTLLTSMFLHFGFEHLMNNMLILALIGWNLEYEIGKIKFILIYFLSGMAGNLLSAWMELQTGEFAVSAGASGAIFGLIGAAFYVAIRNKGQFGEISGRGLLFMIGVSLYYGFTSEGVDNFAHIGGLVAGFFLAILLYWKRKQKASSDIWS